MAIYEIDFCGNILAKIVIENDVPKVIACIDGYANAVTIENITIEEVDQ